jgi:hypothetical protein
MAETQRVPMSSPFDDMLAKNKKRFDELYGGSRPVGPASGPAASTSRPSRTAPPSAHPAIRLDAESSVVRLLNERYGKDWRYEVLEQQRDGDEAIVLCKLVFGRQGAVRTQFGRATVGRGGSVAGASGSVRFKLDVSGTDPGEDAAFRRAAEAALNNCVELI